MGSPCEIQLYAPAARVAADVAEQVMADVERLEARYSRYRETSLLCEINRVAAAGGTIVVDEETTALLNYAATCHAQSGGLFDITSGVLRRAWNFRSGVVPSAAEVRELLDVVGWHRLRWEPPTLTFTLPGMELDFGGIVKEYAADRAAALCREHAIAHGLVNLGGDIAVIGPHPDGAPWSIGVRHPRQAGSVLATVSLHRGALATSGDYERCIAIDGERFGHILDPRTGWPVRQMASVSVVADLCVIAGSASTIAMLKQAEGPAWLEELGVRHLWVDVNGNSGINL
jgi:thiamine biosynthesis lipoprotein